MVHPLLISKLPQELTFLEQWMLVTTNEHKQTAAAAAEHRLQPPQQQLLSGFMSDVYSRAVLLQYWSAPHRYSQLNSLERVLLSALEGGEALLHLATAMRQRLTPEQDRHKRSW